MKGLLRQGPQAFRREALQSSEPFGHGCSGTAKHGCLRNIAKHGFAACDTRETLQTHVFAEFAVSANAESGQDGHAEHFGHLNRETS